MWLTLPNLLTLLRIVMTPFILIELSRGEYQTGLWLFAGAALTDFLDGGLARGFGGQSKMGQYLDPIADKILLSAIYIGLAMAKSVPVWLVALIFGRDAWILLLSWIALRFTQFRNLKPSLWGKASTLFQMAGAVAVIGARAYGSDRLLRASGFLMNGVALLAMISGADYSWRGILYLTRRRQTAR